MYKAHTHIAKQRAFTLIEVIISVSIFAIISSIVFAGMIQFLEIRDRIEQKNTTLVNLQKTFLLLSNDFRYLVNRSTKDEYDEPSQHILKIRDSDPLIELVSFYPDIALNSLNVPRKLLWQLHDGTLSRKQYPVIDNSNNTKSITQHLLHDIKQIDFDVHYVESNKTYKTDNWDKDGLIPSLVGITIRLQNDIEYYRLFEIGSEGVTP